MEVNVTNMDFNEVTIKDASGNVHEYDLEEELTINRHDLRKELEEQSSKYMFWTGMLERVRANLEVAERELEFVESELYEPIRVKLRQTMGGTSNPTKAQIEAMINQQNSYQEYRKKVEEASYQVKRLAYIVKAFEQRKDMLVQISTSDRKQREYEQALKQI